ncbi:cilia- and flagella-associated protein 97 isoform X1 [Oncorhynchus keta]|uniref:cilia- and flagella-associated protein 97 isoform X1 n=1 Tax=Oncorhynchus keta TaxID=8018 RepID=UPI00227C5B5E|nr:cilia- and flagella-associated protein 97 isoform X1 [Oncorhynchus keta]
MYSPKELEGEVDHSFFDSDADCDSISKEQGKSERKSEISSEARKEPDIQPEAPQTERRSGTERSGGGTRDPSPAGVIFQPRTEEKGHGFEAKDRRSRSSSISSNKSESEVKDGSGAEEVSSIHSKSSSDIRTASSAEEQEEGANDDEDGYHQSQDESEEESGRPLGQRLLPGPNGTQHGIPKKPVRKLRHRSLSPSSTSSESETDESYSSGESCSSEPSHSVDMVHTGCPEPSPKPGLPTHQTSMPSSPRWRPPRLGSAAPREIPHTTVTLEEEEDTVTDVTPLSTPDVSPAQSLDLGVGRVVVEEEGVGPGGVGVRQQQHRGTEGSAPTGNLSSIPQEEEEGGSWNPDVEEAFLSRLGSGLAIDCPSGGRNRKNYSFSNDEVRQIDRENQRLLRQLSRPSPHSRPGSTGGTSTTSSSRRRSNGGGGGPPPVRLYHSALNRQREQQRIEKENLAFLRRLESVRPTRGMKRAEQLADYQRQAGYLGIATSLSAMDRSPSKMERSSSRTSPGKSPRPGSTNRNHHSARASSAIATTSTPLPRHASTAASRAAWS